MGWSIDIITEELSAIFDPAGIKFKAEYPDSTTPRVHITFDSQTDLPLETKRAIVKKFPDNIHVFFLRTAIPNLRGNNESD